MSKDGGPAFPMDFSHEKEGGWYQDGMSLRDWFAGQALIGLLIEAGIEKSDDDIEGQCWDAYRYADAMLKERNK